MMINNTIFASNLILNIFLDLNNSETNFNFENKNFKIKKTLFKEKFASLRFKNYFKRLIVDLKSS